MYKSRKWKMQCQFPPIKHSEQFNHFDFNIWTNINGLEFIIRTNFGWFAVTEYSMHAQFADCHIFLRYFHKRPSLIGWCKNNRQFCTWLWIQPFRWLNSLLATRNIWSEPYEYCYYIFFIDENGPRNNVFYLKLME